MLPPTSEFKHMAPFCNGKGNIFRVQHHPMGTIANRNNRREYGK
jgi:hypothetical protein